MNRDRILAVMLGVTGGLIVVAGMLVGLGQPELGIATLLIGSSGFIATSAERRKSPKLTCQQGQQPK